ncbi:SDR family NAD(P)-dependent oxidoreductase, partial [Klebsiella pneumoniae]
STSGIGLGIAKALARQGANIVLNGFGDVDGPRAEVLAAGQAAGAQVAYHGADMSRVADIEDMVQYSVRNFGQIDILVNNAGIQHVARVED